MAVGRAADADVLAAVPVQLVVAALLPGRAQFETSYHSSPAAVSTFVGAHVRVGLDIVVGRGAGAGRDRRPSGGRRLDGQRVRADVVDAERERAVERPLPVGGDSPGVP